MNIIRQALEEPTNTRSADGALVGAAAGRCKPFDSAGYLRVRIPTGEPLTINGGAR